MEESISGLSLEEELDQIKHQLLALKPRLLETHHITELGVFGSYVRGEQTVFSDVYILVDFDPDFRLGF